MKGLITKATMILLGISLTACSYQWRETDPGIDSNELFSRIDEVFEVGQLSTTGSEASIFYDVVKNDLQSVLFYAEGPGPMGSAESVVAFNDFSFMGAPDITRKDVQNAMVIFTRGVSSSGQEVFALLIDIILHGDNKRYTKVFVNTAPAVVQDNEFAIQLRGGGADITLHSFDVEGDSFKKVIQLDVGVFYDGEATDTLIGRVSTLQGFFP